MTLRHYKVVVAPGAERALTRLPEKVASAIVEFILGPLSENPNRVGHELKYELSGLWSARRGAYRVIYEIHGLEVRVLRIDHRSDVYRSR